MTSPTKDNRGFVLIIVLALVGVLSVVVAGATRSARNESAAATRDQASVIASSIADTCVERWVRYVKDGVDNDAWSDFDEILDPGNDGYSVDDFIPPGGDGTVVYIPREDAAWSAQQKSFHRYKVYRLHGGACFVRFDDNNDDALTGPATSTQTCGAGAEGGGAPDNPLCDHDRSITVTAIGVFPVHPSVADVDVYEKAEARATRRAHVQIEAQIQSNEIALIVRKNLTTVGNHAVKVCGAGGISVDETMNDKNDVCACGPEHDTAQNIAKCTGCGGFSVPCADPFNNAAPVAIPWSDGATPGGPAYIALPPLPAPAPNGYGITLLDDDGPAFRPNGIPSRAFNGVGGYDMSAPGVSCEFYFERPFTAVDTAPATDANKRIVYVWDHNDTDVVATAVAYGMTVFPVAYPTYSCVAPQTPNPVPVPCKWELGASKVACSAGESMCWKPVALLGDGTNANFFGTGAQESTYTDGAPNDFFQPYKDYAVPFAYPQATPPTWAGLCGGMAGQGAGGPDKDEALEFNHVGWTAGDHLHAGDNIDGDEWPASHWIFANGMIDAHFYLVGIGSSGKPMRVGIISEVPLRFEDKVYAICPTCDATAWGSLAGSCDESLLPKTGAGYFAYVKDTCRFPDGERVIGDAFCQEFRMDDADCWVGNIRTNGKNAAGAFGFGGYCYTTGSGTTTGTCAEPSLCLDDDNTVVGNLLTSGGTAGPNGPVHNLDICLGDHNEIFATLVYANDDFIMRDHNEIMGDVLVDNWLSNDTSGLHMRRHNEFTGRVIVDSSMWADDHNDFYWGGGIGGNVLYVVDDRVLYVDAPW